MNNSFPKEFTKQTEETKTFTQSQGLQFPRIEGEDDAIRQAYLAVMMSSSSPSHHSSSRGQIRENLTRDDHRLTIRKMSAFSRFMIRPSNYVSMSCGQNMLKRSVTFFKNLYLMNRQEGIQMNREMSTQVHHMISERRRREKLNESFQHLRSLLPPGTKKDKASVLASTIEYLTSLKHQVEELSKRNEVLEAQLLTRTNFSQFQQNEVEE